MKSGFGNVVKPKMVALKEAAGAVEGMHVPAGWRESGLASACLKMKKGYCGSAQEGTA
jgi:hypothetical protein